MEQSSIERKVAEIMGVDVVLRKRIINDDIDKASFDVRTVASILTDILDKSVYGLKEIVDND